MKTNFAKIDFAIKRSEKLRYYFDNFPRAFKVYRGHSYLFLSNRKCF